MSDSEPSVFDERVDEAIAAYLEAERLGQSPDLDALLAQHPELADELSSFFADRNCLAELARLPAGPGNGQRLTPKQKAVPDSTGEGCRYVGLEAHARGGLGEVFTATDTELHRVVAVKRIQDRCAGDAGSRRRFLLEAEVTARLEHPGVVPVHGLYRDEGGRPCYAMRFIEGQTLNDALRAYHAGPADPVAFRRLLQCFIQVCETVAYAHSRGVIHRDLKPPNIMLGKFGETLVVDWGLAKVVGRNAEGASADQESPLRPVADARGDETAMGTVVGTLAYMSPEQAVGRWDVVDCTSDVYSLGAVLYALLTGQARWDSGNWLELQQKIQRGDFPRPRKVKPSVPRALEAVCQKAMALKPEDRYPSARALASEVELWLADEPVKAYREPAIERLGRWGRRRRKHLVTYGVSAVIALVALTVAAWIISLEKAKTESEQMLREIEKVEQWRSSRIARRLQGAFRRLDERARHTVDGVAVQVGQDPRLDRPELLPLRRDLLHKSLDFWEATGAQGTHSRRSGALAYDLARVCTRSAMVVGDDDQLAERYAGQAIEFLREAGEAGYFREAAAVDRLGNDSALDPLRRRADFRQFLQEREAKADGPRP